MWGRVRRRRNWGKCETEEADLAGEAEESIYIGNSVQEDAGKREGEEAEEEDESGS